MKQRAHSRPIAALLAAAIFAVALSTTAQAKVSTFTADVVKDIAPGEEHSFPSEQTAVGGTLYFLADDGTHGRDALWRSDGSEAGTVLVKDIIQPGNVAGRAIPIPPGGLTDVGDRLFFTAEHDGTGGRELWKSDGTPEGTVVVKDFPPGDTPGNVHKLVDLAGALFFVVGFHQLWRSDGTAEGTVMVKDIGEDGQIFEIAAVGDTLFLSVGGTELWKSDGTEAGTTMVKSFEFPSPGNLMAVGDTLFFEARDEEHGGELWKSDGTPEGTVMLRDIDPGPASSDPGRPVPVGQTLFFSADDGTHGSELWKSDGTRDGTVMVSDIHPEFGSGPLSLAALGDSLFFSADDGSRGREPWISDGTAVGTRIVEEIHPGGRDTHSMPGSDRRSGPTSTATIAGRVLFVAKDGAHGRELWESDGTAEGTVMVRDVEREDDDPGDMGGPLEVGDNSFFEAVDDEHGVELWTARPLENVAPCPDDPATACVTGPADFSAFEHDVRVLSGAGGAGIVVRGDDNDISIEDGFAGTLNAIGDQNRIDGSDDGDEIATTGCGNVVKSRAGDDDVVVDDFDGCSDRTALVRAGGGDDRVVSKSQELAVLKGERDDDRLKGGGGGDRIRGGKGEDTIKSRAGGDRVRGGRDGDVIRGGRGEDRLKGNADDDVVRGERGRDSVHGNTGDDVVKGNQGRDRVFGGKHDDRLRGGKHNDVLDGGLGDDACRGGRGNDVSRRCE